MLSVLEVRYCLHKYDANVKVNFRMTVSFRWLLSSQIEALIQCKKKIDRLPCFPKNGVNGVKRPHSGQSVCSSRTSIW